MEKKRKMVQKELLLQQERENLEMVEQVFGFLPLMVNGSQKGRWNNLTLYKYVYLGNKKFIKTIFSTRTKTYSL